MIVIPRPATATRPIARLAVAPGRMFGRKARQKTKGNALFPLMSCDAPGAAASHRLSQDGRKKARRAAVFHGKKGGNPPKTMAWEILIRKGARMAGGNGRVAFATLLDFYDESALTGTRRGSRNRPPAVIDGVALWGRRLWFPVLFDK